MDTWTRCSTPLKGAVLLTLSLLVVAGCSSSSGSRSSGCSGGCCRGPTAGPSGALDNPVPVTPPVASGAVTTLPGVSAAASGQRPYGGQKTCPVTGEELGSMGPAIPVTVQGQTVYVCCRGCVAKLQRDPNAYLAKVAAERAAGQ